MHWSEWAALLLAAIIAVPFVLLFWYVLVFAWGAAVSIREGRKPPVTAETAFGLFTKQDQGWSGYVEADGKELDVWVRDANGEPNAGFLERLHAILDDLPRLERVARQQVDGISNAHELSSISDASDPDAGPVEFTLNFSYDEEYWGESVFVDFRAGQVVGWTVVD